MVALADDNLEYVAITVRARRNEAGVAGPVSCVGPYRPRGVFRPPAARRVPEATFVGQTR